MKKIIIAIIIALIALTVSCRSNNGENKSEETTSESNSNNEVSLDNNEKNKESQSDKNTTESKEKNISGSTTSTNGKKKIYKEKLDKIQEEVKKLESTSGESTAERKNVAGQEYDRWDKALNEIYAELRKDLSKSDMSNLEQDEKNWIKRKEDNALKAADEYKGGTEENVAYSASLAATTKERCYELVDKYMK